MPCILPSIITKAGNKLKIKQALLYRNDIILRQSYAMFAVLWAAFEKATNLTPNKQYFGQGESLARALVGMCYAWLVDHEANKNLDAITRVNWLLQTITLPKYHEKYIYHWSSMWISGTIAYIRLMAEDILTTETKNNIDNMLKIECDRMVEILNHIEEDPLAFVDMKYWMSYDGDKEAVRAKQRISLLGSVLDSWIIDTKAEETAGRARVLSMCGNLYGRSDYIDAAKVFASVTFAHEQVIYGVSITNVTKDLVVYNHGYGPNYAYAIAALYGIAEAHFSFIVADQPAPPEIIYGQECRDVYTRNVTDITYPSDCHINLFLLQGNQENITHEHDPEVRWLSGDLRYSLALLPCYALVADSATQDNVICDMAKIVSCLSNDLTWMPSYVECLPSETNLTDRTINHLIQNVEHYSQVAYKWLVFEKMVKRNKLFETLDGWLRGKLQGNKI